MIRLQVYSRISLIASNPVTETLLNDPCRSSKRSLTWSCFLKT